MMSQWRNIMVKAVISQNLVIKISYKFLLRVLYTTS